MSEFSRVSTSALDVANYLLSLAAQEERGIDPLSLQKLLYYAHCWSLAEGQRLFQDEIQAWKHGPVAPQVWKAYSGSTEVRVDGQKYFELSADEMDIAYATWQAYKHLSGLELSQKTHRQNGAWRKARRGLPDSAESKHSLRLEDMSAEGEYLRTEAERNMVQNWDDIAESEL